jgi:RNA recognition motif-containing protein
MSSGEDAKKAIAALNGQIFMDRTLSVAEARPQQPRERHGFERKRGGFGGGFGEGRGTGRGRR